eukprot:Selendium_serpulae@DN3408_c0_g1_i1.p1
MSAVMACEFRWIRWTGLTAEVVDAEAALRVGQMVAQLGAVVRNTGLEQYRHFGGGTGIGTGIGTGTDGLFPSQLFGAAGGPLSSLGLGGNVLGTAHADLSGVYALVGVATLFSVAAVAWLLLATQVWFQAYRGVLHRGCLVSLGGLSTPSGAMVLQVGQQIEEELFEAETARTADSGAVQSTGRRRPPSKCIREYQARIVNMM